MLTPYQFASNTPIQAIDIDGLEMYYVADGSTIGKIGDNTQVRLVSDEDVKTVKGYIQWANHSKEPDKYREYAISKANQFSCDVGMTNEELNLRSFMSTIKQAENHFNGSLPYNAKHGFTKGKLNTFTDKSYREAPEDYKSHPYINSKGSSAAGAYQILKTTFSRQLENNSLVTDFGPESQDQAAIGIFKDSKVLNNIMSGDFSNAIKGLVKDPWGYIQFSSLPGGGQEKSGLTESDVINTIKENRANELKGNSDIATPQGELIKNK